jgi:cellulose synthase/poly-beta-1,6-N-acetylglucosamine synthase-like glycosyltransferase
MNHFEIIFGLSAFLIFYTYAGYPMLLYLLAKACNRTVQKKSIFPTVSLIIAAYNEEDGIEDKIKNSLNLNYPCDAIEIIVASDGSTDSTNSIVQRYAPKGIKLLCLPRQGKLLALNETIMHSHSDILVFSDANTLFDPQAIKNLVANFADPQVGGVCGNQRYTEPAVQDNTSRGELLYWNYDKWLKTMESLTGSIVSADGAIYAIRRQLYRKPMSPYVVDDFAISTAVIEQGHRLVFDSEAIGYEKPMDRAQDEFSRKLRIVNHGLMGLLMRRKLLNPLRYGIYSLILFSHKLLRRLVPFFLIFLLIASVSLSSEAFFYKYAAMAQVIFYMLAAIGFTVRKKSIGRWKLLYIPFFYCLANVAAFWAILGLLAGKRIQVWNPQR